LNWWACAAQNGTQQYFPAGVFTKYESTISKSVVKKVIKIDMGIPKKKGARDAVTELLAEAKDTEECWQIAKMAGLNMVELHAKVAHLSNGLQRMGIGNRLRAKNFDAKSIIRDSKGFIFRPKDV
jgi:hypothetical protein